MRIWGEFRNEKTCNAVSKDAALRQGPVTPCPAYSKRTALVFDAPCHLPQKFDHTATHFLTYSFMLHTVGEWKVQRSLAILRSTWAACWCRSMSRCVCVACADLISHISSDCCLNVIATQQTVCRSSPLGRPPAARATKHIPLYLSILIAHRPSVSKQQRQKQQPRQLQSFHLMW